jgi:hypothetical protein
VLWSWLLVAITVVYTHLDLLFLFGLNLGLSLYSLEEELLLPGRLLLLRSFLLLLLFVLALLGRLILLLLLILLRYNSHFLTLLSGPAVPFLLLLLGSDE